MDSLHCPPQFHAIVLCALKQIREASIRSVSRAHFQLTMYILIIVRV